MTGGVDVLDLAGRRGRTCVLFDECEMDPDRTLYAAAWAEARTRWEAAGAVPGLLRCFLDRDAAAWGEEAGDDMRELLEMYVDEYWPVISGAAPMLPVGWLDGWQSTPEELAQAQVEAALRELPE